MERILLKSGDIISLKNSQSGEIFNLEIISSPLGEGGSSVVYEAKSHDSWLSCKFRLKELYPENIEGITRSENHQLVIDKSCAAEYMAAQEKFDKALELLWEFAYSDDTGSYTVCPLGKFVGEYGAQYLITQWMPSDNINTLKLIGSNDFYTIAKVCLKTASAIAEFHRRGYINFDIKPENILYSPKTDNVAFFDTDTVFKQDSEEKMRIFFSDGAAPEFVNGFEKLYSEKADVYSIGSMLHRFIMGENYFAGQYSLNIANRELLMADISAVNEVNPSVVALVTKIWSKCNFGNPVRRCTDAELIMMLAELTEQLSPQSIYAENSYIPAPQTMNISCIDEFYSLRQQLLNEKFIFVQGLHGIGKTDFVSGYALDSRRYYHTIVWTSYVGSIKETVAKIRFAGIDDNEYPRCERLFEAKFSQLKKMDNGMLLIIDGYNASDKFAVEFLKSLDIHILITSTCSNTDFEHSHIYTMKKGQEGMFNVEEKSRFYNKMGQLKNVSCSLRIFYTVLMWLCMTILVFATAMYEFVSESYGILVIVSIMVSVILKVMIFKRSEKEAIFSICRKQCRTHYKETSLWINNENNQQLFEISNPEFISQAENHRHKFRIIYGVVAIVCGILTALISLAISSFPFLLASYSVILLVVFLMDFIHSEKGIHRNYNLQFGGTEKKHKRSLYEIYSFKDKTECDGNLSTACMRMIIYNEYKTQCNLWGTVDIISKVFAVVSILIIAMNTLFPISDDYFRMPDFLPDNAGLYICIIVFVMFSVIPVSISRSFYCDTKDFLFTVNCEDKSYISERFSEYINESLLKKLAFARGIYNFAILQFEKGVPIYEIRPSERPTFEQYCVTQCSRTSFYFFTMIAFEFCIIVWHMAIYAATIPLIAINMCFALWWYLSGMYTVNKRILGIKK